MFSEFMISFITRNLFHRFQNIRNVKAAGKEKSTVGNSTSGTAGSRWNNRYFGGIIRKLDDRKKNIIREHGFRILLEYDGCLVPRVFVQWLADQVDVNYGDIVVGGKIISFSQESVHLFLGIPVKTSVSSKTLSLQSPDFLKKSMRLLSPSSKPLAPSWYATICLMMTFFLC